MVIASVLVVAFQWTELGNVCFVFMIKCISIVHFWFKFRTFRFLSLLSYIQILFVLCIIILKDIRLMGFSYQNCLSVAHFMYIKKKNTKTISNNVIIKNSLKYFFSFAFGFVLRVYPSKDIYLNHRTFKSLGIVLQQLRYLVDYL